MHKQQPVMADRPFVRVDGDCQLDILSYNTYVQLASLTITTKDKPTE